MSKSLGNLVSLEDALNQYSPDALRIFFLGSHYRSPLTYSEEGLTATERAAERLRNVMRDGIENLADSLDPLPYKHRFLQAMDSDLNTPQALAALFDLAREINRAIESGQGVSQAQKTLEKLGNILGLTFRQPQRKTSEGEAKPFIDLLVETRSELRAARQYDLADRVRTHLDELGVVLEDTSQGTLWKYR
jgi:cysteinyl-tRNA synthetase